MMPAVNFNPRAPCGARLCKHRTSKSYLIYFNPRAPCGARRHTPQRPRRSTSFQPTRPLRGATASGCTTMRFLPNFNPRAPCGARHLSRLIAKEKILAFQPTRPLRGATVQSAMAYLEVEISTHAPLAGRDAGRVNRGAVRRDFNPRAPCGARLRAAPPPCRGRDFNPRAPCGARLPD